MTVYQKRTFQYVIIENIPENAEAISIYVDPEPFFDNIVLVINTTLNVVEETFSTLNEAFDRYQTIGE